MTKDDESRFIRRRKRFAWLPTTCPTSGQPFWLERVWVQEYYDEALDAWFPYRVDPR